ncbi:MAG: ceramidase domain-containing protein [Elusimicrobia bacterium]|nr:ceramidase domain-containing protein [Elusimicrobiota bacterium]
MDPRLIVPLPPGSPWSSWARPDIKHCEANLAGWIAAPADSWSNLAYLAVGAWLLTASAHRRGRTLGAIAVAVGLTSFAFHASYTAVGQSLDYAGMFLLAGWLVARGASRAGWVRAEGPAWAGTMAAGFAAYAAFWRLRLPVQTVMIALVAAALALEARLLAVGRGGARGPLGLALALVAAAYACWHLDHADGWCRPDDHLRQWHAAWHVLTAAAFLPLARAHAALPEAA